MDTKDWGEPQKIRAIRFIRLTRDTGEILYVRPDMISAMGQCKGGFDNKYWTFLRIDGSIDWVRETPAFISSLMDKAGA